jgi:hypothetical protein
MSFWKTFGKWAIPAGAIAATVLTGGAASPLIGMALGAGSGLASTKLSGGSWKQAALNAGIGGALGGIGGGALKGMGTVGKVGTQAARYAPSAIGAAKALTPNAPVAQSGGGLTAPPQLGLQQGQGFLNPLGTSVQRRTDLSGMGTRYYG